MKNLKPLFAVNLALWLAAWTFSVYYYPLLPHRIPTHFGFNGQADAWSQKSWLVIFLMPLLQTLVLGLLGVFYRYPQYSNIPSTVALEALEPEYRERVYGMIRRMLLAIGTWLSAILVYLHFEMLQAGLSSRQKIDPGVMIVFVGGMLLFLAIYMIRMLRETRQMVNEARARRAAIGNSGVKRG